MVPDLSPMADAGSRGPDRAPLVVFVCVHNAGRSQMAEGLLRAAALVHELGSDRGG